MEKINLKDCIRNIPDFPKPGILFRDITTLLKNKRAYKLAVNALVNKSRTFLFQETLRSKKVRDKYKNKKIDIVVAVEARGFILGGAVAHRLGAGFVPVRKIGKLPAKTNSVTYALEYGTDTLEIHHDAIKPSDKVLIVDDLLATGGTVKAVVDLVEQLKGKIVGIAFLIELTDLKGRDKLGNYPIYSLIKF